MNVIIVFASFVGNTETMASYIQPVLEKKGHTVESKDVIYSNSAEIMDYDLILLGSPTYEPRMIHDDMLEFYEELNTLDLKGKKAASFGPGDTAWPDFCTAVEMLEDRLAERGAELVGKGLMIDGVVEEAEQKVIEWADSLTL